MEEIRKPVIGLIPLYDDDKDSYWMLPGYMKVISKYGALPVMLPLTDDMDDLNECIGLCDGFLLTGGHDVSPSVYGQKKSEYCGNSCELRDIMEGIVLDNAVKYNIPVLGICRGIQFMNAYFGGTLFQDLPSEKPSQTEHHMDKPYNRAVHEIDVIENTLLADIIGAGRHGVNSYHHQAVKELAPGLSVMAVSEDGIVEALSKDDNDFIVGVQWHPEFWFEDNEDSVNLIKAFIGACKNVSRSKGI